MPPQLQGHALIASKQNIYSVLNEYAAWSPQQITARFEDIYRMNSCALFAKLLVPKWYRCLNVIMCRYSSVSRKQPITRSNFFRNLTLMQISKHKYLDTYMLKNVTWVENMSNASQTKMAESQMSFFTLFYKASPKVTKCLYRKRIPDCRNYNSCDPQMLRLAAALKQEQKRAACCVTDIYK